MTTLLSQTSLAQQVGCLFMSFPARRWVLISHSRGTCWKTGLWIARPEDSCRIDGWPCPVSWAFDLLVLLWLTWLSYYEGHSIDQVTFPIRVFKQLGVDTVVCMFYAMLIFTKEKILMLNSDQCGRRPQFWLCSGRSCFVEWCKKSPIKLSSDLLTSLQHLFLAGLAGTHPLRGPNEDEFGVRFPPLSDAYDLELRRHVHQTWKKVVSPESNRRLHEGVYAYVGGPT
jgi:hypothetical protein